MKENLILRESKLPEILATDDHLRLERNRDELPVTVTVIVDGGESLMAMNFIQ